MVSVKEDQLQSRIYTDRVTILKLKAPYHFSRHGRFLAT
jgi:hypothetical protein